MTGPKRVTEKQLAANRRNALQCTGPRTPQGKDASRWNALQHGVLAKAVIPMPLEDYESRSEFDALLAALVDDLVPASPLEEMLVERIATCYWRLARILRAEGAAIVTRQDARIRGAALPTLGELLSRTGAYKSPPSRADRLDNLTNALTDKARLRALMVEDDPKWREATDQELSAAAQKLLAELQRPAREQARARALEEAARSLPPLAETAPLVRYEAALERQFYRAIDALERIQRLRAGGFVPPPIKITVDNLSDGAP